MQTKLDAGAIAIDRSTKEPLIEALEIAGANIKKEKSILCPFHDDKTPSAAIYEDAGVWRFQCHGCDRNMDVWDVREHNNGRKVLPVIEKDKKRDEKAARVFPTVAAIKGAYPGAEAVYLYQHPQTKGVDMAVVRYRVAGKKRFAQFRPHPDGFEERAPESGRPLYNRTVVAAAQRVLVAEGEKCVHTLRDIGIVATTSSGGALAASKSDWTPLAGKDVYLWPDNDANGATYVSDVQAILADLNPPPTLHLINYKPESLPEGGDVADLIEQWGDMPAADKASLVELIIKEAKPVGGSASLLTLIKETISGNRMAIPWPWPQLSQMTKALAPGAVTLLCGDPGSTKSFFMLECFAYWHVNGVKCALYELEETIEFHQLRALVQRTGVGGLFDDVWIRNNPDRALALHEQHAAYIDGFTRCLSVVQTGSVTHKDIIAWVKAKAEAGFRIIGVDPITIADGDDKPWVADRKLLAELGIILRAHGASLILVTHPKGGKAGAMGMSGLSGGQAYQRFAQVILWLRVHEPRKSCNVACGEITQHVEVNREIHMLKTRSAKGSNLSLAYNFDGNQLRFNECGLIVAEAKSEPQTRKHHDHQPRDSEDLFQ